MKDLPEACMEIENSLPLWVGGDLEPSAQRDVEDHLARCARCSEKAAATRLSRTRLLQGLELERRAIGGGPDPWPAIRAALRAEGLVGARSATPLRPAERRSRFPMRTAAAAALLFGVVFAWTRFSGAPSSPSHVADSGKVRIDPIPATSGDTPTVPVQTAGARLRPLKPGERQLRDGAQFFYPTNSDTNTQAVGLERAPTTPPR